MSLVSSVSHELMDRCEIERNPISLAAVRALGEAHLKCCMQMYHALALITKGSVRTLIRPVEETNGAEAWLLIHSRYAPDTQHRQYALMQKIMMPAKPWCDHTEGFESGLRSWEMDVGEWERASGTALADAVKYTVMMNMFFLETDCSWVHIPTVPLFEQPCCSGVAPLETMERIRPRHLEMKRVQMMTGCKFTLCRKVRERAKVKTNTREEIARPARPTRALQTSTRARTVANLDIERKTAGIPVEERMTIPPTEILAKARVKTQVKGKANTWTLSKQNNFSHLKQPQPCRIFRKIRVLLEAFRAWIRGSWV